DFETYQQCMQKVADYSNSLPKWLLKGQTPNEADLLKVVLRSEEKEWAPEFKLPEPTVSEGFNNPLLDNMMPFAIPHVAMNDPCPCGSGLSYRHCHGKHLN
nr:SEC-C domain-containing protein [Bacteroidales bacterium]